MAGSTTRYTWPRESRPRGSKWHAAHEPSRPTTVCMTVGVAMPAPLTAMSCSGNVGDHSSWRTKKFPAAFVVAVCGTPPSASCVASKIVTVAPASGGESAAAVW